MKPKKTYQFGILAEKITMIFLSLKGYRIMAWRYKTRFGEIDIVAVKGREIVFIEVKARKSAQNFFEIVTNRQSSRIKSAARIFIGKNRHFCEYKQRFDFVFVNRFLWPKHYKNFFAE